ncbi:hypothetical protein KUCAC02_004966, partial [Chaenocephalus aceratus]
MPSSPGGQFTFRPLPPPPPPPHACTCARPAPYTQVSLQRKTMPTRCQASQGGQGGDTSSSTDQAQLHNSWVLNSNIPLETSGISPLSGQLYPDENDIFFSFFSNRHFLFKQGSGSSALLSGAGQGYPLTSGTVYSPPPRPLPRSSVTRPLFTFNKPHRCCNWKCTALSASLLTLTLALLLTYVIASFCSYLEDRRLILSMSNPKMYSSIPFEFPFHPQPWPGPSTSAHRFPSFALRADIQPSTQPLNFPPVVVLKVTAEQAGWLKWASTGF